MTLELERETLEQVPKGTYKFLRSLGDIRLNQGWHDKFVVIREDNACSCIDLTASQLIEGKRFIMHAHIRGDDRIVNASCVAYPIHKERDITLMPLDINEAIQVIKGLLSEESTFVQTGKEPI